MMPQSLVYARQKTSGKNRKLDRFGLLLAGIGEDCGRKAMTTTHPPSRPRFKSLYDPEEFDPKRFSPPDELFRFEAACTNLPAKSVIAIHGWPSSGKTPTATWLGWRLGLDPIHLDDFNFSHRPGFNPETDAYGFDEEAMRGEIAVRRVRGTIIIDGVCACRVCSPDILLDLGGWNQSHLSRTLMKFVGEYNGPSFEGRLRTFRCLRRRP